MPLPEGGFALNTADELASSFGFNVDPVVVMDGDNVTVDLSVGEGRAIFEFSAIEANRKAFDCELAVRMDMPIPGYDVGFSGHLQAASLSNRDQFRLALDKMYGKEFDWMRHLSRAYEMARESFLSASVAIDLDSVEVDFSTRYRLDRTIGEEGVSILFGMGDASKTYQTLSICLSLAGGYYWMDRAPLYQSPVLYLDYEASAAEHARRKHRLLLGVDWGVGAGTMQYMPARGIPFVEQVEAVRRELARTGAGVLVVDSAVAACGGDPVKPEPVRAMFNAMNALRVPVIIIAHCTKEGGSDYPFGSIFWHNLARLTWNIQKVSSEDSPNIQTAWFNRKNNNDRKLRSFGVELCFDDPAGAVTLADCAVEAGIESKAGDLAAITEALRSARESLTTDDIVDMTGIKKKTVQNRLGEMRKRGEVDRIILRGTSAAGRWELRTPSPVVDGVAS